jgi:hypothetical protein
LNQLGAPPAFLDATQSQAWADIVAAAPDVLITNDRIIMELAARSLAGWRSGERSKVVWLRLNYRLLGKLLMPMAARRRLMFGYRH